MATYKTQQEIMEEITIIRESLPALYERNYDVYLEKIIDLNELEYKLKQSARK